MRDDGGVTIRWIRRTRADGDSWTGEVPLGEDSERYEVDILVRHDGGADAERRDIVGALCRRRRTGRFRNGAIGA